jgi:hypothetical protein
VRDRQRDAPDGDEPRGEDERSQWPSTFSFVVS